MEEGGGTQLLQFLEGKLCAHILGRMITQTAAMFGDLGSAAPAAAGELQKNKWKMDGAVDVAWSVS